MGKCAALISINRFAGITRRHKAVDTHCPCAPDKDQERQGDRDNVLLLSFTFLVSHPNL